MQMQALLAVKMDVNVYYLKKIYYIKGASGVLFFF